MKSRSLFICLVLLMLMLLLAAPADAESSTITQISPAVGYTGSTTTVTITGTNFNTSSVQVRLKMPDENNITSTISTLSATQIVCKFTLSSSKTTGAWDLVVINEDGSEVVKVDGFTIRPPMTLTSLSPTSARTNNDSVDVTIIGTGLSEISGFYLYNEDYTNITATSVDAVSSTKVTGSLDLTDKSEATYKVCIKDSFNTVKCGLSFEILSDAVGSLDVSSSPSGASIYVDNDYKGTTPDTVSNLDVGSHKLLIKKSGYTEYAKMVKVTAGGTTTVDADLNAITTEPTAEKTPVPITAITTVKTTRKSTITTPTPWPSATPTPASPVGTLVIIGGIALAFIAIRKH